MIKEIKEVTNSTTVPLVGLTHKLAKKTKLRSAHFLVAKRGTTAVGLRRESNFSVFTKVDTQVLLLKEVGRDCTKRAIAVAVKNGSAITYIKNDSIIQLSVDGTTKVLGAIKRVKGENINIGTVLHEK
jgi:hypothetical protein